MDLVLQMWHQWTKICENVFNNVGTAVDDQGLGSVGPTLHITPFYEVLYVFLTQSLLTTLRRYEQVGRRRVWGNTQRSQWMVERSPSCLRGDRKTWTWSPALRKKPRSGSAVWRKSSQTWTISLRRRKRSSILFKRLWCWGAIRALFFQISL